MKNRIGLSGRANDERDLDPVRRVLTVFVGTCATVLLLAAGSPPLQAQARTAPEDEQAFHRLVDGQRMINTDDLSILAAQNWTEMSDPVRPYVTRLTDGNSLSCGLATQEEMASIREAIDRMPQGLTPSGKYALAPPAANISVNYTGFTPEAQAAFQRAVDIWSSLLITTVPIEIEASFTTFDSRRHSGGDPHQILGLCSHVKLCLPFGLINQIRGEDLDPDDPDILVTMSSSEDWYFGLDGRPGEDQHLILFRLSCMRSVMAWDFMTASGSTNQPRKPSMGSAMTTFRRCSIVVSSIQRSTGWSTKMNTPTHPLS